MGQWIETLDRLVWGPGLLAALLLTGGMLTVRLHFLPWRRLPWALGQALRPGRAGGPGLSPFQALMTSLAATVGTGTIVGVASAMVLGGPGALGWMWLSAAAGMATKFAECTLAARRRAPAGRCWCCKRGWAAALAGCWRCCGRPLLSARPSASAA